MRIASHRHTHDRSVKILRVVIHDPAQAFLAVLALTAEQLHSVDRRHSAAVDRIVTQCFVLNRLVDDLTVYFSYARIFHIPDDIPDRVDLRNSRTAISSMWPIIWESSLRCSGVVIPSTPNTT